MDFYHENNHFIFDDINTVSLNDLKNFIDRPYYHHEDAIIKKYSFENWLDNLIITD